MNVPKPPSSSDSDSSGAQESDVASISVPSDAPYGFEIILQQLKRGHNRDASKSPLSSDSKSDHQLSDVSSASSASEARILEGRSSVETPKFPYSSDSESDYQSRQVVDHRSLKLHVDCPYAWCHIFPEYALRRQYALRHPPTSREEFPNCMKHESRVIRG